MPEAPGWLRAIIYTTGSVFVAFDPNPRRKLREWYRSGRQCPALEPGDERRARDRR